MELTSLGQEQERMAWNEPDKIALTFEGRRFTYMQWRDRTNQLANALLKQGVMKGDKVSILAYNCQHFFELYVACCKIGAVMVPINFRLVGRELIYILDDSDTVAFIFTEDFQDAVESIKSSLDKVKLFIHVGFEKKCPDYAVDYENFLADSSKDLPHHTIRENDPVSLIYTSGTTGFPKGAVFTNRMHASTVAGLTEWKLNYADIFLCVGPAFHSAALHISVSHLLMGGSVVIMKHFDIKGVLDNFQKEKITTVFMVPTMWESAATYPEIDHYDLSSLRVLISVGAPLPDSTKLKILHSFPNADLNEYYGSTEAGAITNLRHADQRRKVNCVGQVIFGVNIRLVDDDDNDVPAGEVGEVAVSSAQCISSYYNKPEATAKTIRNGWLHTGDMGRWDDEHYLYLVDRKIDMIISGGENIYPREIEEVLLLNQKIAEAAVVGTPDEKWGETVNAFIVLTPASQMSEDEVLAYCKENLAKYKIPRKFIFTENLPRNASGKVLKRELVKQVQ
ncbi:MAG: long-chain-fatty-acid--CoA ligase [Syntrophales bacterium]|jgi:acyl-CoA synthetase (AMP-forming)/AMP-acid ligase II|nr:long-chain-fatty-acid--CoA ligase [Syntrophales bacterium]MDY0044580.1 long-chain-fatty-acid--CoA ligase [Syntrophales bacterium]